jgi:hypothetical protein
MGYRLRILITEHAAVVILEVMLLSSRCCPYPLMEDQPNEKFAFGGSSSLVQGMRTRSGVFAFAFGMDAMDSKSKG